MKKLKDNIKKLKMALLPDKILLKVIVLIKEIFIKNNL
jgi:hypothetical protein